MVASVCVRESESESVCVCVCVEKREHTSVGDNRVYGVATITRLLKNMGLFCKRAL